MTRITFSLPHANFGGISREAALALLREAGVVGAHEESSPHDRHYGLSVPARFGIIAARVLLKT